MAWTSKNSGKPMHINHFFGINIMKQTWWDASDLTMGRSSRYIQIISTRHVEIWANYHPIWSLKHPLKTAVSKSTPQPQPALAVPRPAHQADCHSWSSTPSVSFLAPPVDTAGEQLHFLVWIISNAVLKNLAFLEIPLWKTEHCLFFSHWNSWSIIINHHKSS